MSNKKLSILGITAVLLLGWAIVQSRIANRSSKAVKTTHTTLIQGLNPGKIAKISVRASESSVTLKRNQNSFVVTQKADYPAQASEINNLITSVLDIRTGELITDNPDNFSDLRVEEDNARNIIKFFDDNNQLITGVVMGQKSNSPGGYVRTVNSNKVYAVQTIPRINSSAMHYINKNLIQVQKDEIIQVDVTDPNGTYSLTSEPNNSEIKLVEIPEGKQQKASEIKGVFTALSELSFTDVRKDTGELEFKYKYICRLQNELKYTLDIAKKDDKYHLKPGVQFTGSKQIYKAVGTESKQELKKKEAKLLAIENAEKFNNKHIGWIYEIYGYKAKNLTKSLNDLLEDKEKKDSEQKEESNNSSAQKQ